MPASDFHFAVLTVLKHEGIYSNDPDDPGGATKYGISLRYLKRSGQGDFDYDGDIDVEDIKKMSLGEAKSIYARDWWDRYNYAAIHSRIVATKVFDLAVNMGAKQAHKVIQRATWSASGVPNLIKDDGILGAISYQTINNFHSTTLMPAIRSEAAGFYRSLNQPKFIKGWLNRAYS